MPLLPAPPEPTTMRVRQVCAGGRQGERRPGCWRLGAGFCSRRRCHRVAAVHHSAALDARGGAAALETQTHPSTNHLRRWGVLCSASGDHHAPRRPRRAHHARHQSAQGGHSGKCISLPKEGCIGTLAVWQAYLLACVVGDVKRRSATAATLTADARRQRAGGTWRALLGG